MRRLLLLTLVALALAPAAQAVTAPDLVRFVSGNPSADVACPADWPALLTSLGAPDDVQGIAWHAEQKVRLAPWICQTVEKGDFFSLGRALNVIAHEAAHLRGIEDEGEASCWGLLWAQDLARRHFRVEFYSVQSRMVGDGALTYHRSSPAPYRTLCG